MNEQTTQLCEMEQELLTVRDKYKPYFDLKNEVLKLKVERLKLYLFIEAAFLVGASFTLGHLLTVLSLP